MFGNPTMLKVGLWNTINMGMANYLLVTRYNISMVLAFKMGMSAAPDKNIVSQSEDIGSRS